MGVPLLLTEEFELVIMIAVATEEMHGSDRVLTSEDYKASRGWLGVFSTRAKWRFSLSDCRTSLLTTPTLSERRFKSAI